MEWPTLVAVNLRKEIKMGQYLINLTQSLIKSNHYDELASVIGNRTITENIMMHLLVNDIAKMRPETLGKIMCAFEIGDVMTTSKEISKYVGFNGDCEEMLRRLVAFCLASLIRDRLANTCVGDMPPFTRG